jgi:hypothetical protein
MGQDVRMITELLKRAMAAAAELPASEQDRVAELLLDAIDDQLWDALLQRPSPALDELERQAHADIPAGRTEPLDPDKL